MDAEQALIIMAGTDARAKEALAPHARVTQAGSERVLIVSGDRSGLNRLRQMPGVQRVITAADDAEDLTGLNAAESLFVQAWVEGRRPKTRKGEGMSWDAPGFDPPDRPRT